MAEIAQYFLLIVLGVIPSLVWLFLYLQQATHHEPKILLFGTFALGALLAPLAILGQALFGFVIKQYVPGFEVADSNAFFLWAAFVEEAVKFLVVFFLVIHEPNFNEPVDAMIYLITAALGFAAIENVLVLFNNIEYGFNVTLQVLGLRFLGATLLHALSSALVGYFLALAWFYHHHSRKFIWFGIVAATLFHFSFNALLLNLSFISAWLSSSAILLLMFLLVFVLFTKIKHRSPSRLSTTAPTSAS